MGGGLVLIGILVIVLGLAVFGGSGSDQGVLVLLALLACGLASIGFGIYVILGG